MHRDRIKLGSGPANTATCNGCTDPPAGRMPIALLIAEDDESLGDTMAEALADAGFEVRLARNGMEALSMLLGGYRPHMLLTDLDMPVLDGLALLRHLAALLPGTPSLIVTGHPPEDELDALRRSQGAGAMLLLRKPVRMTEIIKAIQAVLPAHFAQPSKLAGEGC